MTQGLTQGNGFSQRYASSLKVSLRVMDSLSVFLMNYNSLKVIISSFMKAVLDSPISTGRSMLSLLRSLQPCLFFF